MNLLGGVYLMGQKVEAKAQAGDWIISFDYLGTEIGYCGTHQRVRRVCKSKPECKKCLEEWIATGKKNAVGKDTIKITDIRIYKLEDTIPDMKISREK